MRLRRTASWPRPPSSTVDGQRYDAAGSVQAGTVQTLEGAKINISGAPPAPTVSGAQVLRGDIPTKNATLLVTSSVLTPPAT